MSLSLGSARRARPDKDAPANPGALAASPGRRRNLPQAVLGVVLVVAAGLAFTATSLKVGSSSSVLALSTRVAAGSVIEASDLTSVQVKASGGTGLIPVTEESGVLGRTAAVTLASGSLLTSSQLGTVSPTAGQSEIEVLVKFGAYPTDLEPGARVAVAASTSGSGTSASAGVSPLSGDPQATVVTVTASSSGDGSAAVELSADAQDAASISALPSGDDVLVTVAAGGA